MNRLNFGRLSGTIVDMCNGHGTFLDRGELHQVVKFISTADSAACARPSLRLKEENTACASWSHRLSRTRRAESLLLASGLSYGFGLRLILLRSVAGRLPPIICQPCGVLTHTWSTWSLIRVVLPSVTCL